MAYLPRTLIHWAMNHVAVTKKDWKLQLIPISLLVQSMFEWGLCWWSLQSPHHSTWAQSLPQKEAMKWTLKTSVDFLLLPSFKTWMIAHDIQEKTFQWEVLLNQTSNDQNPCNRKQWKTWSLFLQITEIVCLFVCFYITWITIKGRMVLSKTILS